MLRGLSVLKCIIPAEPMLVARENSYMKILQEVDFGLWLVSFLLQYPTRAKSDLPRSCEARS